MHYMDIVSYSEETIPANIFLFKVSNSAGFHQVNVCWDVIKSLLNNCWSILKTIGTML